MCGDEQKHVLDVLHGEAFADNAPAETYAKLLNNGTYLSSIRRICRVFEAKHEVRECRNQLWHPKHSKPNLAATAPKQVWTWDITKLLGQAEWNYYHRYVILDTDSRCVMRWILPTRNLSIVANN